jgi:hypothetical protein
MGGYGISLGGAPRTATGTFSPLLARGLALWDSGEPLVVVSTDALGWPAAAAESVRQRVGDATGLPAPRLLLTASHTHNGSALPGVLDPNMAYGLTDTASIEAYLQTLCDAVVVLVQSLLAGERTTVQLDYQVTSANFSYNREGLPYTETAVPVLAARTGGGPPLAVLFGYGAHPVAAGYQTLWDGDYPSAAAAAIEATLPGCTALFLPGPAGDQDPAGVRGWLLRSSLGAQLAAAVVTAVTSPGTALTGLGAADLSSVRLPLDVDSSPGNLAAVRTAYVSRAAASPLGWEVRHARSVIGLIDGGAAIDTAVTVALQAWRFAAGTPLQLAFVGGELTSGYAVALRQRHGGTAGLWLGGYGPGLASYLPSDELLPPIRSGGSYGGGWDSDFPGIAGGSMCIYGPIGHFLAGTGGVEPTLIAALTSLLA